MRTTGLLSLLLLVSGCSADATESDPKSSSIKFGPFLGLPFAEACQLASEEDKVVFIDFFTTWCGPCKQLDGTTWQDEAVIEFLNEKTVPLKIDAEKALALADRYRVDAYPTMVFLRPDGTEIDRLVGYRDAMQFLSEAVDGLAGKTALVRARELVESGSGKLATPRMRLARELATRGEYEEALSEYLWCWDHGAEGQAGFAGVRVSFLLHEIKTLAEQYPEARRAMIDRRDTVARELIEAGGGVMDAMDLGSLNYYFGEVEDSIEIFSELPSEGDVAKASRRALLQHVFEPLLEAKRYAEAVDAAGDVFEIVVFEMGTYAMSSMIGHKIPRAKPRLISKVCSWYEALVGAGEEEAADKVAEHLLGYFDSVETLDELASHAERAGNDEAAAKWRARIR